MDKQTEKRVVETLQRTNLLVNIERTTEETDKIVKFVDKLPVLEKEIIVRKYLDREADYTTHSNVYQDLEISEPSYTKLRKKALHKIAIELGIEQP